MFNEGVGVILGHQPDTVVTIRPVLDYILGDGPALCDCCAVYGVGGVSGCQFCMLKTTARETGSGRVFAQGQLWLPDGHALRGDVHGAAPHGKTPELLQEWRKTIRQKMTSGDKTTADSLMKHFGIRGPAALESVAQPFPPRAIADMMHNVTNNDKLLRRLQVVHARTHASQPAITYYYGTWVRGYVRRRFDNDDDE